MIADEDAYNDLCAYTLDHALADPSFIHQHVVDAYAAQTADESTKPITLTFALAGLYLHLEKGFTGREVQLAHMKMAKTRRRWPRFELPRDRGSITAADVLAAPEGTERGEAIDAWCASVWTPYAGSRDEIENLLRECGVL